MFTVSPLSSRNQLGKYLNELGLIGIGVEIGTHQGEYASILLKRWKGALYCIDPWKELPEYRSQEVYLSNRQSTRSIDLELARVALSPYADRVWLYAYTSQAALDLFHNGSLCFVYIDGNHERPYIDNDLEGWWHKVKSGGILAGHDIMCPGPTSSPDNWGRYIQPAVCDFAHKYRLDVSLICEEQNAPWTYYMVKP